MKRQFKCCVWCYVLIPASAETGARAKESRGVTVLLSLKFFFFLSLNRPAIWPVSEVQIDSGPK